MQALEKWLRRLLLASAVNTMLWLSGLGCLVQALLLVSIIGIPLALFLAASPTILLYLLIGLPLWLVFRRRSIDVAVAAAAAPMLAVAVLVPLWANRKVEAEAKAWKSGDRGGPLRLPTGRSVALLDSDDAPGVCGEMCQRLLFSGAARMVLVGRPAALNGAAPLTAWFIAPNRGPCRPPSLPALRAQKQDLGFDMIGEHLPYLSSRLAAVYGVGHCLFAETRRIDSADIVLSDEYIGNGPGPRGTFDLRLVRVDRYGRFRILFRVDGRLIEQMRRSRGIAYPLAGLLALTPPSGDDSGTQPGHWTWGHARDLGDRKRYWIFQYIVNDLSIGGLVDDLGRTYRPEAAAKLTPDG